MKIVFFGTPEFGAEILRKLIQAGHKPVLVVTVPDKPVGRNKKLTPSETKQVAVEHGIAVLEVEKYTNEVTTKLAEVEPNLFVLAAFGKILPQQVLDIPKKGALNVHPSLLPKYRGPSPVQETILKGEERTGVTIMLMDKDIDHGPIVAQQELSEPIDEMNAEELKAKLAILGGNLLSDVIPGWAAGKIESEPQDHSKATFTKRIRKEDGKIDWNQPALYIARQVRAFHPWPGTYTFWQGKLLKILKANARDTGGQSSFTPGATIPWQEGFAVVAGQGILVVEQLQLEGKNAVSAKDFLLGHKDFLVRILG